MGQNYQQPPTSSATAAGITMPHQQNLLWESPHWKRLEYTASLRVPKSAISIVCRFYFILFYLRCRGSFRKCQWIGHNLDSLTQQAGFHSVKKKKSQRYVLSPTLFLFQGICYGRNISKRLQFHLLAPPMFFLYSFIQTYSLFTLGAQNWSSFYIASLVLFFSVGSVHLEIGWFTGY